MTTTKEIADQNKDEQYILDELAYAVERNTWFELGGHLSTKLQAMLKSKDAEIERLREVVMLLVAYDEHEEDIHKGAVMWDVLIEAAHAALKETR